MAWWPRQRRQFADQGLELSRAFLGFRSSSLLTGLPIWRKETTSSLFLPDSVPTQSRFAPVNLLLYGRKGCGKSLTTTALTKFMDLAFQWTAKKYGTLRRRVISNYYLKFAVDAGPIAEELLEVEDPKTYERRVERVPVEPCSDQIVDEMATFPPWGRHKLVGIDEAADIFSSLRATSRHVRDWGAVLRQQRKMHSEYIMNTQFPDQIAYGQVGRAIDLLCYMTNLNLSQGDGSVDILVFDYHYQWTEAWGKYGSRLPEPWQYDWTVTVTGLLKAADDYNTDEYILPVWMDPGLRALRRRKVSALTGDLGVDMDAVQDQDPRNFAGEGLTLAYGGAAGG